MKCALCSHEFAEGELTCHSSCPLAHHCVVICCPRCGYQTVDESQSTIVTLLNRLRRLTTQERNLTGDSSS